MQEQTFIMKAEEKRLDYGRFSIEPLTKGFGHTLGNALRRVLLSSLKGASITQVKIDGVTHKFSTLEGMGEDIIELILNLKKVKLAYDKSEPITASLSVQGPKVVTAGDINFPANVKLVNADLVIANLAKGAKLNVEIQVESGFGYSPAEERPTNTIGVIPVDALFSPVERVSYRVESTRVGRRTDYDKVVLEVYTDGSQDAEDVVREASRILVEYFQQLHSPALGDEEAAPTAASLASTPVNDNLKLSIEELGLPTRITNALKAGGYKTVQDLSNASTKELSQVKNMGTKSLDLVNKSLKKKDLSLRGEE